MNNWYLSVIGDWLLVSQSSVHLLSTCTAYHFYLSSSTRSELSHYNEHEWPKSAWMTGERVNDSKSAWMTGERVNDRRAREWLEERVNDRRARERPESACIAWMTEERVNDRRAREWLEERVNDRRAHEWPKSAWMTGERVNDSNLRESWHKGRHAETKARAETLPHSPCCASALLCDARLRERVMLGGLSPPHPPPHPHHCAREDGKCYSLSDRCCC